MLDVHVDSDTETAKLAAKLTKKIEEQVHTIQM